MDKITTAMLFEICRYLSFREMMQLSMIGKRYKEKMNDILQIFSEREAQRILLSKCALLRNPFIEQEVPLNTLSQHNWFGFLQNQLLSRKWLRIKLKQTLPKIFGGDEYDALIK